MKKLFSFIAAALISASMFAATEVLTFGDATAYGYTNPEVGAATNVPVGSTVSKGNVVLTSIAKGGSTENRFWNSNGTITFRMAKGGAQVSLKTIDGSKLTEVVVYGNAQIGQTLDQIGGTAVIASDNKSQTWTGEADSLLFESKASGSTINFDSIKVTYAAGNTFAAPAAPTYPANQVKAVECATYAATSDFGEWGSGTAFSREAEGLKYVTTHLGYFGICFEGAKALNCAEMEALHLDIYSAEDMSVRVVPIHGGPEVGVTKNITAGEWNAIDIQLSEFENGTGWTNTYQIKLDNCPNRTFYVNNVFFYTTQAPAADTEAPTALTATLAGTTYFTASITAQASDNKAAVIFEVYNGETLLATQLGASATATTINVAGLQPSQTYNLTVKVKDEAGNYAAADAAVAATTVALALPAAAPAPTFAAEDVMSLYSDAYTAATHMNNPNANWWDQPSLAEVALAEGNNAYFYYGRMSGMNGWEYSTFDATGFDKFAADIYPMGTAENPAGTVVTLEFGPLCVGEGKDYAVAGTEVTVGQWNHVVIDLEGKDLSQMYQVKAISYAGLGEFFVDNMLFYKEAPAAENVTIYCQVDAQWWLNDGADVAVYCYKDGADYGLGFPGKRMDKVEGATNVWTAEVPADLDGMIFVRCNPVTADPVAYNWNAKTADLTLPTDGKNLYTITTDNYCWASDECLCAGEWSVYGAAANEVAYELNGGATNAYNWVTVEDMYNDFMADTQDPDILTMAEYKAMADMLGGTGLCAKLLHPETAFANAEKWGWLKSYIMAVHAEQAAAGASALPDNGAGAAWRYAVGAFFFDTQRTGWPKSADFTTCGVSSLAAYQSYWKGAFNNPTTVEETTTLWAPYLEGSTFDGWYANADFSGDKVVTIDATTSGTLYAHFIEYIPTIAEVVAMEQDVTTKAKGVVNYVSGKNLYIQDATGAILIYLSANPDAAVVAGKEVVISGTTTLYGGAPELKNASVVSVSEGTPLPVVTKTLAELLAEPLKYFGQCVRVEGVKLVKYDSYNNPFVAEGLDTVQCYKMVLEPADYPVGAKVNVNAIAGYYNKFQFIGDAAGIELASAAKKDTYAYPAREDGAFTLENKWIYSSVEDNFSENLPGPADNVRGMAAKDGKMYFINRSNASITVVDGKTGYMLDPIFITGEHLFEAETLNEEGAPTGEYAPAVTLPFNDIKFDNAGNCLIGACVSGGQHFMVYKVDLTTGAATLVVDEKLYDNPEFGEALQDQATAWRFDAFGVYGDVNSHAIIMGADANSFNVYKWTIENGVAGTAEQIDASLDPTSDASLLIVNGAVSVTAFGTAPQVFPVDEDYFYVDGWSTLPMLYDMDGTLAEDFINCPTGVAIANNPGDTCVMNQGHNGLCEFQVGEEYFIVMAATNTVGAPTSAFALYKYADAAKSFADMEPLWYFPANGMGALTNGCRTAVPSVEVNGTEATIYLYTNNNGYAVYTFTGREHAPVKDALENIETVNAEKIIENGQLYIIKNGVRYTVLGARVK